MRKRVRKKRRLAEFREFGFEVRLTLKPGLTEAERDSLMDRFILEPIEGNGLLCGGGGGPDVLEFFVHRASRGTATEADRQAVAAWAGEQPEIVEHAVGSLIDAWHEGPVLSYETATSPGNAA